MAVAQEAGVADASAQPRSGTRPAPHERHHHPIPPAPRWSGADVDCVADGVRRGKPRPLPTLRRREGDGAAALWIVWAPEQGRCSWSDWTLCSRSRRPSRRVTPYPAARVRVAWRIQPIRGPRSGWRTHSSACRSSGASKARASSSTCTLAGSTARHRAISPQPAQGGVPKQGASRPPAFPYCP